MWLSQCRACSSAFFSLSRQAHVLGGVHHAVACHHATTQVGDLVRCTTDIDTDLTRIAA
jgi:hypothetical protein